MQVHRVFIEVGYYAGGGTDGAFISETINHFETTVNANSSGDAVRIAMAQFGGQDRCRVTYRGTM